MTDPLPDLPDFCWPVDTSCVTDWDANSVEADPDADPPVEAVPLYDAATKARAVALAGQTLRLLTGFRVGGCPILVRPCRAGYHEPTYRAFPVGWGHGSGASTPWFPVNLGGTWLNIGCGCPGVCSCSRVSEIRLHGPASAITEVLIDGVALDASAYRLDPGGRLVRTDGDGWPLTQNMDLPDSDPGTWSVAYTPGAAVDGLGAWAAGVLAGEYLLAYTGAACRLPDTTTQIVRTGVTVTLGIGAFPNGRTGIREVDIYLERWNPGGHRSVPTVWSPDLHRPRSTGRVTP